jgi:hypothetical protein
MLDAIARLDQSICARKPSGRRTNLAMQERIECQPEPAARCSRVITRRQVSAVATFEDGLKFCIAARHIRRGPERLEVVPTEGLRLICAYKGSVSVTPPALLEEMARFGKHIAHARIFHQATFVANRENS